MEKYSLMSEFQPLFVFLQKLLAEDKTYFDAADADGDGKLNEKEFAAFQNPEHHPHMHETLIDLTLKEKDKNKDGKIDLKEFMGDICMS